MGKTMELSSKKGQLVSKAMLLLLFFVSVFTPRTEAQTVGDLQPQGTHITWYNAASGGQVVLKTTPIVEGTHYYASQTVNGCESTTRLDVLAYVNPQPQGSLSANGPLCSSGTGTLTWTKTAGTGPYTIVYNDGTANRTAGGVTSGTAFNVFTNPVTTSTTYTLVSVQDANCTRTDGFTGGSETINVNPNPTPSFTTQPGAIAYTYFVLTYTTESGKSNYEWTIPGTTPTNYSIIAGGGNTNSVTLKYLTAGTKTVTVNYADNGCTAPIAASSMATNVSVSNTGVPVQGGKLVYILWPSDPGYDPLVTHGLIAATADQSTGIAWITGGNTQTTRNGNTSVVIGTGQANTNFMKAQTGYTGGAAKVCDDYTNTDTGTGVYSDWYLPGLLDLDIMCDFKSSIGGFTADDYYWSSSENTGSTEGQRCTFNGFCYPGWNSKATNYRVRAVRSF